MVNLRIAAALAGIAFAVSTSAHQVNAAVKAKKPTIGTKGTTQMAGGQGQFGATYTVTDGGGYGPINFTLKSAEYSIERLNIQPGTSFAPKTGEKLLIIHYRIKNPNNRDLYFSSRELFQIVDGNNNTLRDIGFSRRESEKQPVQFTMKPGQGIDDLVTCVVVPSQGAMPKLILELGRAGSGERVTRYTLGAGPNQVKPVPAPYAADSTGASALDLVPAQIGTTYTAGFFDISVESVAFVDGPIGDRKPGNGNRFLVATARVTNQTFKSIYFKNTLVPTLITDDDEKTTDCRIFKGKRDEPWDGDQIDAGDSALLRYVFVVPNTVNGKTLKIAESVNNSGGLSRAFSYDISSVK